jgi:hypothetical protein
MYSNLYLAMDVNGSDCSESSRCSEFMKQGRCHDSFAALPAWGNGMFSAETINLAGLLAYKFCAKTDKRVLRVVLGG